MIKLIIITIMISGGAVQVAVLYGLPAERRVAKSKGDHHDHDHDDNDDDDNDHHDDNDDDDNDCDEM